MRSVSNKAGVLKTDTVNCLPTQTAFLSAGFAVSVLPLLSFLSSYIDSFVQF